MNHFLMNMKCLGWNIEWRTVRSQNGTKIGGIIEGILADLTCYTESATHRNRW